jgi:type VI secretion system (T6SS) effector TldE1-like protein
MIHGAFHLKPETALVIGGHSFPAFSGDGALRNRRTHMCVPDKGPIPVGVYYIVDRPTGGQFGPVWDLLKSGWFALYARDQVVDDELFCNAVLRGQFRLHPKGFRGLSKGCITLEKASDFAILREMLEAAQVYPIPNTPFATCGTVTVS